MERDLGIKEELIKKALSVSIEAHANPEKPRFVETEIGDGPKQVIVAFPGSWSLNDWFAGDGKGKSFGETKIDDKKFSSLQSKFLSLRSLGNDEFAVVNEAFMKRFLEIPQDGNETFCKEVEDAVKDNKRIVFTGHSSGGPIAIYATVWFLEQYLRPQKHALHPLCLTFGSPLTTDRTFCHAIQREDWSDIFVHFVVKVDIVPRILLAPLSSTRESLEKILPLLETRHGPDSIDQEKMESLFKNVMKNASCVANHAACELTGSKHTLFDTISKFIKLSPYRPCGTYVFCTETGRLVIKKNPDAVLQLLFYSLQIESEKELQKRAEESLKAHWTYEAALSKSLAPHNVVCLQNLRELPLSSDDAGHSALNDLNLCASARLCLRAAGELEKKRLDNQKMIEGKKDEIEKALKALENYRTASKNDHVGYYDAFKLQKVEEDFKANVKRLELAAIWDDIIEMLRLRELPDRFEAEKEWVDLGTRFRRLVEPIDIANYYRHSRHDVAGPYMEKGRPSRYKYTQKWREHAEQMKKDSHERAEKSDRDSYDESSFWAEVEELNVAFSNKKPWPEIEGRASALEEKLRKWYDNEEVKKDVFLEKSTLVKWWRSLPDNHKANSCIKGLLPS